MNVVLEQEIQVIKLQSIYKYAFSLLHSNLLYMINLFQVTQGGYYPPPQPQPQPQPQYPYYDPYSQYPSNQPGYYPPQPQPQPQPPQPQPQPQPQPGDAGEDGEDEGGDEDEEPAAATTTAASKQPPTPAPAAQEEGAEDEGEYPEDYSENEK